MNLFKDLLKKKIYLDHAATTPVLPEVKQIMEKYWIEEFYNPSAIYDKGVEARKDLEAKRTRIARVLEVGTKDIVFTGSGTEADNLAILGAFEAFRGKIKKPHIIISAIEHPGIQEAAREVERRGGEVSIVGVDEQGYVDPQDILKLITPETVLVSIMLANNEIGSLEPISKIARLIKEERKKNNSHLPYIHTDASQGTNFLRVNVPTLGVDMLTLDASKMYGPKGVGLLVVRPGVYLHPIIFGGGQEKGLRSGTESLALVAGMTCALELAQRDREKESLRLNTLKDRLIQHFNEKYKEAVINTPRESLPNIVSVSFPGEIAELLAIKLDQKGIMVSTGSSCGNMKEGGTKTLVALGRADLRESTLRFSFGRSTTEKDIEKTISTFDKIMRQ
jgi:cysteine desulfurase